MLTFKEKKGQIPVRGAKKFDYLKKKKSYSNVVFYFAQFSCSSKFIPKNQTLKSNYDTI